MSFLTCLCTWLGAQFYTSRKITPATEDVSRMKQLIKGCKPADMDVDVLTLGGVSEPKTVVVAEPGVLEFNTEGGVTELQNTCRIIDSTNKQASEQKTAVTWIGIDYGRCPPEVTAGWRWVLLIIAVESIGCMVLWSIWIVTVGPLLDLRAVSSSHSTGIIQRCLE
ncbi:hypothetical protein SCA6_003393 [Theobroma cacao]